MKQYSKEIKEKLNNLSVKTLYLKILILDFKENPIKEVQGISQSGSININGSAAIRRTINFVMFANKENNNLENLDNLIALNKKIKVQVGYNSPCPEETGDIIWFDCGTYLISSASTSINTNGATINISAKDKMVQLDGSVGGVFPSTVTFHEYEEVYNIDNEKRIQIVIPTIYEIIREAVHTYGQQPYDKIKIFDLEKKSLLLVKYMGDKNLGFTMDYSAFKEIDDYDINYPILFQRGEDIGYIETDLTYPGELVFSAGDNVVSLLNKIVQSLGNYEFFYDLNGDFIFQEKKNFLYNNIVSFEDILNISYLKEYPEEWYSDIINDTKGITSLNYSPKYDSIKNDYIVWGKRSSPSGLSTDIRYHLMIENKPVLNYCEQYLYKHITNNVEYYSCSSKANLADSEKGITLIGRPCQEWREELYRQALLRQNEGKNDGFCDAELLAEWRKMYDTMAVYASQLDTGYWDGWNYNLLQDPGQLTYWLDYLDTNNSLNMYSVSAIGRRTKVLKADQCNSLFENEIPEVLFVPPPITLEERSEIIERNKEKNYTICFTTHDFINNKLGISSTSASAYTLIKELLYQHLTYNSSITITSLPKYYLEPNNLIYFKSLENNIQGRYVINSITLPLNYNGTMSIQASQALSKI